jgi:hypothetical protein
MVYNMTLVDYNRLVDDVWRRIRGSFGIEGEFGDSSDGPAVSKTVQPGTSTNVSVSVWNLLFETAEGSPQFFLPHA